MSDSIDKTAPVQIDTSHSNNQIPLDKHRVQELIINIQSNQNFPIGCIAGLIAAMCGAIIWAFITSITNFQIGWMAIGIGFLVGISVRKFGNGIDKVYGYMGGALSLFGCILGNILAVFILLGKENNISFFLVISGFDYSQIFSLIAATFHAMDIVFYAIAIYEGYKFSFRMITESELQTVAVSDR